VRRDSIVDYSWVRLVDVLREAGKSLDSRSFGFLLLHLAGTLRCKIG
jgi:hypothetical protein